MTAATAWTICTPQVEVRIVVVDNPVDRMVVTVVPRDDEHVAGYWCGAADALRSAPRPAAEQAIELTAMLEARGGVLGRPPLALDTRCSPGMTEPELRACVRVALDAVRPPAPDVEPY